MRVAVVGAGAIGSLLGSRLMAAGHEVVLLARGDHLRALRAKGLRVSGIGGGTFRIRAEESPPEGFAPETILWTVKTYDLVPSAELVVRSSPTPVPTLLPQNGLGVEELGAHALRAAGWSHPEPYLVRAVNTVPATLVGPGEVRAAGSGELLLPAPAGENAAAVRTLETLLSSSGLAVRTSPDLPREVWRKAVVNAAINPVTALHGVPNGRLLEEPYRAEALHLLSEATRAAEHAGYSFTATELRADFDRVVRATSENRSSMLQDVDRGHRTEIDAISGEILRTALRAGLDLPATRAVLERLTRGPPTGASSSRGQPS